MRNDPHGFADLRARRQVMNCTLSWVDRSSNRGGGLYVLHNPTQGGCHGRMALDDITTVVGALARAVRGLRAALGR